MAATVMVETGTLDNAGEVPVPGLLGMDSTQ